MIVVTGWPRSGTSLLMQLLAAGGLTPLMGPRAQVPRPGNRFGLWEFPGAAGDPVAAVKPHIAEPDVHVKLLHRMLQRVLATDLRPAAVVMTDRTPQQAHASRVALFGRAPTVDELIAVRDRTVKALERSKVPFLRVAPADLVRDPAATSSAVAEFLSSHVAVELDVAAMAAVPDPLELHFA